MTYRTLAFIGAGNMSRSIISGLVSSGYPADRIIASNPSTPKLDALKADFGIRTTQFNQEAVSSADAVVLAVKPQLMAQMCEELQGIQMDNTLFISIAAGLTVARLQAMLGGDYDVVRVMPNTPSLLGKGMSGLYARDTVAQTDKDYVSNVMSAVGEALWVDNEADINAVIAAAGSSPAYFFLFLEAMEKETMAMGLAKPQARQLVQQAMLGAADMVCHNPELELSELRAQVTSKGGTTAKAVEHFQSQHLEKTVADAMRAAVARAEEMAKQL